jgi:hypothetical protein
MHLKATIPAVFLAFGFATSAHATSSIDFVDRKDSVPTYSAVRCVAVHPDGRAYRAASEPDGNVSAVLLADLLAGDPGKYSVECTASLDRSHERYTARFEVVKLRKGETGYEAPEYDENDFGYGVKVPLSQTRNRCYDKDTRQMNQACLDDYYGNGRYFLEAYSPAPDVTFNENREYNSNVGVFLKNNPRHPEENTRPVKAQKAASIVSPFR